MKKFFALVIALMLGLNLAATTTAATPGAWDFEAGADHAQDTAQDMIEGRTITYDFNGGFYFELTGWRCNLIYEKSYQSNGTHTIPDTVPRFVWMKFAGWLAPNGVIYQPGDIIQGTGDVTLVAQWVRG